MNKPVLFVLAMASAALCTDIVRAEVETDDEIRSRLVMSCTYEDDFMLARGTFNAAFRAAESNRVRFARIICDLAHTNDSRIAESMVSKLGEYGTPEQLPFLYSQVSNTQHGVDAVRSILEIEGITSNSVAMVDCYLSNTNVIQRDRSAVCSLFFKAIKSSEGPMAVLRYGENVALRYAGTANLYFRLMDEAMIRAESTYQHSQRRLSVLRSVNAMGVSPYQIDYVTNAINELVSYPEADLPE